MKLSFKGWGQMNIEEAQLDFRRAYVGGAPGVLVSGFVWLTAAIVTEGHGVARGFMVLFIGGIFIHPVSTFLCRSLFRRSKEDAGNALAGAALEGTVAMIGGLIASWLFIPLRADYVFAVAAIAAGTRYALFRTIYGDRLFWVLAGLMSGLGLLAIFGRFASVSSPAFAVAGIELFFGGLVLARHLRSRPRSM